MTDKPKRKRRWFRFSLKTMLIVIMLMGGLLGWIAKETVRAERQRRAVETIEKANGEVWYDYEFSEPLVRNWKPKPPASAWLEELVGVDPFADVVVVSICEFAKDVDVLLEHVKILTRLEYLDLNYTAVTDAGLVHLYGLTRLKIVQFYGTQVTKQGIEELRKTLPNCEIRWDDPNINQDRL